MKLGGNTFTRPIDRMSFLFKEKGDKDYDIRKKRRQKIKI